MKAQKLGVAAALMVILALPVTAFAGGKHGSGIAATTAGCTLSGNVVHATGLPTDQLINFNMSSGSGMSGWVLGYTGDGTWSVTVPPASGPTTYQFVSTTWGPNGSKYDVYASCSA
jgi:hypothetical protein